MTYDILLTLPLCDLAEHPADEPYIEAEFAIEFSAKTIKEGDGSASVEIELREITVLETRIWFDDAGSDVIHVDSKTETRMVCWLRSRPKSFWSGIEAKCIERYLREPEWAESSI